MSSTAKQTQQTARQFFKLSVENGAVSAERVAGVLAYLEKHPPAHPLAVLKAYHRLVAAEVAKTRAVVEHAGALAEPALQAIAAAFTARYRRPITAAAQANPALLAGLRVRIGDDVYESSVAGQLAALAAAV